MLAAALASVLAAGSSGAYAHLLPKQNSTINIIDTSAFVIAAVPVSALQGVDDDLNGAASLLEMQRHSKWIAQQFDARFQISSSQEHGTPALTWLLPTHTDDPLSDPDYVVVMHRVNFTSPPTRLRLETDLFGTSATESSMVVTASHGTRSEVAILQAGASSHEFFRGPLATFAHFARVGIEHILKGPDHLLFLIVGLLAVGGWRAWLGVITSFSAAHSVTLSLGAVGIVDVPAGIVEPAIAASIVAMAALHLWQRSQLRRPALRTHLALVFGCGLVHGLGFASAISPALTSTGSRIATLAGFNVGIEIGQGLVVLIALLAADAMKRRSRRARLLRYGSNR